MILHCTAELQEYGEVITQILDLQRLIAFVTFAVFEECTVPSEALLFKHVPHKLRKRQGRQLQDYWSTRFAFEVTHALKTRRIYGIIWSKHLLA